MEDLLWKNIFKVNNDKELVELFKNLPIFNNIPTRQIKNVIKHTHLRHYQEGEVIFKEGDPGLGMYIIKRGKVKLVSKDNKTTLAQLGSGEFFGELSLIDETNRSASAIATEESELVAFFRPDLLYICNLDPSLGVKLLMKLAKIISLRLRNTNNRLKELEGSLNE